MDQQSKVSTIACAFLTAVIIALLIMCHSVRHTQTLLSDLERITSVSPPAATAPDTMAGLGVTEPQGERVPVVQPGTIDEAVAGGKVQASVHRYVQARLALGQKGWLCAKCHFRAYLDGKGSSLNFWRPDAELEFLNRFCDRLALSAFQKARIEYWLWWRRAQVAAVPPDLIDNSESMAWIDRTFDEVMRSELNPSQVEAYNRFSKEDCVPCNSPLEVLLAKVHYTQLEYERHLVTLDFRVGTVFERRYLTYDLDGNVVGRMEFRTTKYIGDESASPSTTIEIVEETRRE